MKTTHNKNEQQSQFSHFCYRLKNAIKIGMWGYKNPQVLKKNNFEMLSGLYDMILKVATENKPYMVNIGVIHPDGEKEEIVSLWAGSGIGADPTKRIEDLIIENQMLKDQITKQLKQEQL